MPGATDVAIDQYPPLPQIAIKVDREAAARYGINVADVADLIQTGIGGGAVSQVFIGERHYDVTVRFPADGAQQSRGDRQSGADLERRRADSAVAGRAHPAADRREHDQSRDEPALSAGEAQLPTIAILPSLVTDAQQGHRREGHVRSGANIASNGAASSRAQQRAEARFGLILGLVLGLMMVLLYAEFGAAAPGRC